MKNGLDFAGQSDDRCGWSARAPTPTMTRWARRRRPRLTVTEKKDPCCRNSADFARQATISEFGWRHARALDQGVFVDRAPGQLPVPAPEARSR